MPAEHSTLDRASAARHVPVMLTEALAALDIRPAGCYVDCTFGQGGHSAAILQRLGPEGRLFALDCDPAAAGAAQAFAQDDRFVFRKSKFSRLGTLLQDWGVQGEVSGILLDLGVSSPQLDDPSRGFSFTADAPLDMRMDTEAGEPAAVWLARTGEVEIARCLFEYGEERYSRRIAGEIVRMRKQSPIRTTADLVAVVDRAMPRKPRNIHFATRVFQAIRIVVNEELEELQAVLHQAVSGLAPGGRLVALSFHSVEDRIVKRFMRAESRAVRQDDFMGNGAGSVSVPRLRVVGRFARPGPEEVGINRRARSAILRVAERLA